MLTRGTLVGVTTPLVVGVPREVKTDEHRVAITPDGVHEMRAPRRARCSSRHDAGAGSGITDDDYRAAGAEIVDAAADVWGRAGLVLKVKEPQADGARATSGPISCSSPTSTSPRTPRSPTRCSTPRTTGVAYETVQLADGQLPLLAPMSEVAGRMAPQIGAHFLERAPRRARRAARRRARRAAGARRRARRRATSAGTRRGSRRAWRPRCSCSTRTSTGCAGSTRSTRAAS